MVFSNGDSLNPIIPESKNKSTPRGSKTIRLPCDRVTYQKMLNDKKIFRNEIDLLIPKHPELFPSAIVDGYHFHSSTAISKKLNLKNQRILLPSTGEVFTLAPCDVMPYMTGFVEDVEIPLFMRRFNVPCWAIAFAFGKDPMYWDRLESSFGRNSIVGTTVRKSENLPKNVLSDEKHTSIKGKKAYIATTAGKGCILGASVCKNANEQALTEGYSHFKNEATNVDPGYAPETVNTDGWGATILAWSSLFPTVTFIYCFLHAFLKIRDRSKKHESFQEASKKVWLAYKANTKRSFCQRVRRLREWALANANGILKESIISLCDKSKKFTPAYDHPDCHRTSNMVDRLMRFMDKHLFNSQYFHGTILAAEQGIRAWSILRNFQPYACSIKNNKKEMVCAAKNLNGFAYRKNWLENLMVSTSMSGMRQ